MAKSQSVIYGFASHTALLCALSDTQRSIKSPPTKHNSQKQNKMTENERRYNVQNENVQGKSSVFCLVFSSGVEWRDNYKLQAYAHTVYRNDQIKQTIKIKL